MTARSSMKRQKRILILGGSGRSASGAIRHLVVSDTVGEIGIAARNLDNLNRVAASAGRKVHPLQLDIADEPRLHSAVEHYDIVLNTAGPGNDLVLNATQAAIGAGKHYCDIAGDGPTVERQLELHVAARNRDVLVIPGMGTSPGLDNLLALHAYRQFDRTEELQLCHHVTAYVARMIAQLRNDGRVDATLQEVIGIMSRPARIFRDGDWIDVDPAKGKVAVDLPMGGQADAYPYSHSQTITLPRCLPDIQKVSRLWSVPNPRFGELMLDQVGRVSRKEASAGDATRSLLETIGGDPDRWLRTEPAGAPVRPLGMMGEGIGWVFWITATGRKDGRVGRYTCWLVDLWGGLALAALRILRGEVSVRGVVPPEGCFDPLPFFEGLRQYRAEKDRDKPLIGETMEWLS